MIHRLMLDDLKKAMQLMDKMGIPTEDRMIWGPQMDKAENIEDYYKRMEKQFFKFKTHVPPEYINPKNRK